MSATGPNAGLEVVRLNGRRLSANLTDAVVGDPSIRRTIEGASEVSITVSDPAGRIRRESFLDEAARIVVDDLRFTLVKVSKSGDNLTLTGEDEIVYLLRRRTGPKKAFRDKVTRAQFIRGLVKEAAGDRVRVYAPELLVEQPIAGDGRANRSTGSDPAPGIPRNATGLTVKGAPATAQQKRIGDQVIRLAMEYNPPRRAVVALLAACIVESVMGTVGMNTSTDGDSIGLLQARTSYVPVNLAKSIPYNVRRFMLEPWTGTSLGGAIKQARAGRAPGDIAQSIQGSAYPDRYALYVDEANEWIDAYNGGTAGSFGGGTETKRYAFEVKKNEDYWTAIKRLADEVNWRAFVVGRTFYFVSEPALLKGRRQMNITDDTRGVDEVNWEIDAGKRANTATVAARAGRWQASPGTVVALDESHGPARGRWLVAELDGSLTNDSVTITLKRASKPKPEPAAETVERGGDPGGPATGGAARMVKWAKGLVGTAEGSGLQRKWAAAIGYSSADPWCSIFLAYGLREICGLSIPSGAGYSGAWLSWSGGKRVSTSSLKPGDLIIYDWGDGGITDHVSLYIGGGRAIHGNWQDKVLEDDARLSSAVGCVRPRY